VEPERFKELALLAESIANENFVNGKTDLDAILLKNNIKLIKGNYEDYFEGNLVHELKKFFLYLNMDLLSESQNPRIRFTIAHELGHYFIDEHRNLLKRGTSLSFNDKSNNSEIEKEANHFASFLLMPSQRFKSLSQKYEKGLSAILSLANTFESSIDSTSIQYIKSNCCAGLVIRWNEDRSIRFSFCSADFAALAKTSLRPIIKKSNEYLGNLKRELALETYKYQILERATPLSRWLASIVPGSVDDLIALEQNIKLGKYGGMTLIIMN
jgi:Zn-dependent peptidase ImmA (M78 family)